MVSPRYPDICVTARSRNPLVLIAAVRAALRRAGIDRTEIGRFSEAALTEKSPKEQIRICQQWTRIALSRC
jgi:hypothetical protein